MSFSIRASIQGFVKGKAKLCCSRRKWADCLGELHRRGHDRTESGAFLLGVRHGDYCVVVQPAYYDDLEPDALSTGAIVLGGRGYGALWRSCQELGLSVIADVHTHPGAPLQSEIDRTNPMIAVAGHVSLIVPDLARRYFGPRHLGIYEYSGSHRWRNWSGDHATDFVYVGFWG